MNQNKIVGFAILTVAALVLLSQSVYTVREIDQVLVIQLGKPLYSVSEPGLHFKVPFLQKVYTFERRLMVFDQDSQEVLSSDKKNLRVDNYAQWRIVDPLKFFQTVRDEFGAVSRLNDIIYSNLREQLGQYTMMEIVSGERTNLMEQIREQTNLQAAQYGIEIVDVRIKRTDLPPENSKAVFRRMQTERERQALQYRAQGEEEAVKIRAQADRDREVLLAEAYREAQTLRGQGDAMAARIYADAFGQNPRFFEFIRTMEAYHGAFASDTTLVLEPNGFFRYFNGLLPGSPGAGPSDGGASMAPDGPAFLMDQMAAPNEAGQSDNGVDRESAAEMHESSGAAALGESTAGAPWVNPP